MLSPLLNVVLLLKGGKGGREKHKRGLAKKICPLLLSGVMVFLNRFELSKSVSAHVSVLSRAHGAIAKVNNR